MALEFSYDTGKGYTATEAYAKLTGYNVGPETVSASLAIYYDDAARIAEVPPIDYLQSTVEMTFGGTYTDVYTAIKAQDARFAGATDV